MKYIVDTNIINRLVDGTIGVYELPTDGSFVATHIQIDELKRTKDDKRRANLLDKFEEIIDEIQPTETFILGVSRLNHGKLGNGENYQAIKTELDARNKKK